ncbi:hypothetical protein BOO91_20875 [Vibrio navarrensis]|uniref:hypothetical protein n=1 Tax=Vibrio navarrensis TaxID=29495 RepID=UPI0018661FA5|nr:hypothetical protein [Vibrio navarrensis]EKF9297375.1 hypothetical protein [Vibrio cholerae]EKF9937213.1 hypothetical protein [Vibrio cholerae]MBE3663368.1 hypothetical protein [Vibrio navarrensis]
MNHVKTGKDSVVIGNVSGEIGEGSVVIGATDQFGNTIINQPMAVGRGASAGPGSIAIGAGASAGSELFQLIDALKSVPEIQSDETLVATINAFRGELSKPEPERSTIQTLWSLITASANVAGAVTFIQQIQTILSL